eukprot:3893834-Pyramimonas_sp.AAC.1
MPAKHAVAATQATLSAAPHAGLTEDQKSGLDHLTLALHAMQMRKQVGTVSASGARSDPEAASSMGGSETRPRPRR